MSTGAHARRGGGRVRVAVADATDPDLSVRLPGPWDPIVDDASHEPDDQRRTFLAMRRLLSPAGIYAVEDVACGAHLSGLMPAACGAAMIDRRGIRGRFDDRLALYSPSGLPPMPPRPTPSLLPRVVWHAELLPGWVAVVAGQLALAAAAGLPADWAVSVAGPAGEREELFSMLREAGVVAGPVEAREDPADGEWPALGLARRAASGSDRPVLYWHAHAVIAPADGHVADWGGLMGAAVAGSWRERVLDLEGGLQAAGCDWSGDHFVGNCWAATPEYLRGLPAPAAYRSAVHGGV